MENEQVYYALTDGLRFSRCGTADDGRTCRNPCGTIRRLFHLRAREAYRFRPLRAFRCDERGKFRRCIAHAVKTIAQHGVTHRLRVQGFDKLGIEPSDDGRRRARRREHTEPRAGTPASAMVGTSGSEAERFALVTPNARSVPTFNSDTTEGTPVKNTCTRPAIKSIFAGTLPLYGTCKKSAPARRRNTSPIRCGALPLPPEA